MSRSIAKMLAGDGGARVARDVFGRSHPRPLAADDEELVALRLAPAVERDVADDDPAGDGGAFEGLPAVRRDRLPDGRRAHSRR